MKQPAEECCFSQEPCLYSAPPHWRIVESRDRISIVLNSQMIIYPSIFLTIGVPILGFAFYRVEEVQEMISLQAWMIVCAAAIFVPWCGILLMYLFQRNLPAWLVYIKNKDSLMLPRQRLQFQGDQIEAVQCISGFYPFASGYQQRWVAQLRLLLKEPTSTRIVLVAGTTVLGVVEKAGNHLASAIGVPFQHVKTAGTETDSSTGGFNSEAQHRVTNETSQKKRGRE